MILDEFGQLATDVCVWCAIDIHEECSKPKDEVGGWFSCCCGTTTVDPTREPDKAGGDATGLKSSGFKDAVSTGRKRAAMLYPIFPGMVCEWSGLRHAGGGPKPIVGCMGNLIFPTKDGTAGNVHHGPNKSVLENGPRNVHRICWSCHQTWHAANNEYYEEPRPEDGKPWLPKHTYEFHDPETWADEAVLRAVSAQRESINPRVADWTRRGVIPEDERIA